MVSFVQFEFEFEYDFNAYVLHMHALQRNVAVITATFVMNQSAGGTEYLIFRTVDIIFR